ncbi:hypothetical protein TURU_153488 [Turdus rufiventris]|nr:hypothetical protein TURU_153488 [Turdus rufiventris]
MLFCRILLTLSRVKLLLESIFYQSWHSHITLTPPSYADPPERAPNHPLWEKKCPSLSGKVDHVQSKLWYTDEKNIYRSYLKYTMSQMYPEKNDVKVERMLNGKAEIKTSNVGIFPLLGKWGGQAKQITVSQGVDLGATFPTPTQQEMASGWALAVESAMWTLIPALSGSKSDPTVDRASGFANPPSPGTRLQAGPRLITKSTRSRAMSDTQTPEQQDEDEDEDEDEDKDEEGQ